MTSCLVLTVSPTADVTLRNDLEAAGIHVIGAVQRSNLVQEAAKLVPDVVVVQAPTVDDELLSLAAALLSTTARPMLFFTNDADADKMKRAIEAGVHAYVVNGYVPSRLRSLVHLAQARFAHEQKLRAELADLSHRFEERKLVDRAKGILMRSRPLSEEEAFGLLRMASMHSNRRVGQVSRQVIDAARDAEALNRAGQLRMLSQRLVKLYALQVLRAQPAESGVRLSESGARIDANLSALAKSLSRSTYGDLLDAVLVPWTGLKTALGTPPDAARLAEVDGWAERVLLQADRLVTQLEISGAATSLQVINVSGRQRMLSQRLAKQALLAALLSGEAAEAAAADAAKCRAEFEQALAFLESAPLSSREIHESLDAAGRSWRAMTAALAGARTAEGSTALADASEALLALFEQLTERYERSMQLLMG